MQQDANYPAGVNDPESRKTQWTPLKRGGAGFRTHKLIEESPHRIVFKAALGAKLFYLLFLFAGISSIIIFSYESTIGKKQLSTSNKIALLGAGFVFIAVGGGTFYAGTKPIVFDKNNGCFWKGWKTPDIVFNTDQIKDWVKLDQIYALQILSEYCRGAKNTHFYSYELNLVLNDGKRINVIDYGNITRLRDDAVKLSAFLGKPIWENLPAIENLF